MADAAAWRRWLVRHHADSRGVWLLFDKKQGGGAPLDYDETVCEALCHGWIDSLVRRVDDGTYARLFTPRRDRNRWSAINRRRYARMAAAGRVNEAGRAVGPAPEDTESSEGRRPLVDGAEAAEGADRDEVPAYIAEGLQQHPEAWELFTSLAPSYRRNYVRWIEFAKRPETRMRRLAEAIDLLKRKQKLGLK